MPKTKYARDRWEYPRMPVVPARIRRRRFALTIALSAIFFAGAALAAGADNQLAQPTDVSTGAVSTDTTATAPTATDSTPEATTTVETTTDATTTDTPPATTTTQSTDAAPGATTDDTATETPPTSTTVAATSTDAASVTTTDDAPTLPAASVPANPVSTTTGPDPSVAPTASASPFGSAHGYAPAATTSVRLTAVHIQKKKPSTPVAKKKPTPVRTLDRPLAIPFHAIAFNPQQWLNDNPGTPTGQAAVAIAINYLGVPYRWGGAAPETGFDCSGLVRFVYAQLGINLVHYAASQFAAFPQLSPAQLQPGDLVFFEPKPDGPGHVGLYIGHDEMIEAPHTGTVVRIASVSGAAAQLGFMGAVRPYANQLFGTLALTSSVESRPAARLSEIPF